MNESRLARERAANVQRAFNNEIYYGGGDDDDNDDDNDDVCL